MYIVIDMGEREEASYGWPSYVYVFPTEGEMEDFAFQLGEQDHRFCKVTPEGIFLSASHWTQGC